MKKTIIYFFTFVFICFILPAILTKRDVTTSVEENSIENITGEQNNINKENIKYDYKNYGTIKLLHKKTNEIEEVPLDEYLYHVVSAEMPSDY